MKIIWSPLAMDRASEIAEYIAQDKPSAAEKWINTVFSKVEQLKSSPEIGRVVPEIRNDQFRELIYGKGAIHSSHDRFVEEGACLQSCYRRTLDQFERPVPVNDKRAILVIWRYVG